MFQRTLAASVTANACNCGISWSLSGCQVTTRQHAAAACCQGKLLTFVHTLLACWSVDFESVLVESVVTFPDVIISGYNDYLALPKMTLDVALVLNLAARHDDSTSMCPGQPLQPRPILDGVIAVAAVA